MAYPGFMFIVLTALLIGTAIAQSPSQPPKGRGHLAPRPSSGADLAPSRSAFAPGPSFAPRHPPASVMSPPPHAASPAPAVTPSVGPPASAPAPVSGAVSNGLALGTLAVGFLVVSLVA